MSSRPSEREFEEVVSRNREQRTAGLVFEPSLSVALSLSDVRLLSRDLAKASAGWEKLRVVENVASLIPRVRGLYMFVWTPPLDLQFVGSAAISGQAWILYVGKAGIAGGTQDTIQDRFLSEYRRYLFAPPEALWADERDEADQARAERMKKFLTLQPLEFWFLPIDQVYQIENLERRLIRLLNPPLNRKGIGPRLRPASRGPAF